MNQIIASIGPIVSEHPEIAAVVLLGLCAFIYLSKATISIGNGDRYYINTKDGER